MMCLMIGFINCQNYTLLLASCQTISHHFVVIDVIDGSQINVDINDGGGIWI